MHHALAAAAFIALSACANPKEMRFRGGAYFGGTLIDDGSSTDLGGVAGGGRMQITAAPESLGGHVEFGARLSAGARNATSTVGGVGLEYRSFDIFAEPVIRGSVSLSNNVRAFVEAFVGYGVSFGDITGRASGLTVTVSDIFSGPSYGGGGGMEFRLSDDLALSIGAELRRTTVNASPFDDIDVQDVSGVVMFGTSWGASEADQ